MKLLVWRVRQKSSFYIYHCIFTIANSSVNDAENCVNDCNVIKLCHSQIELINIQSIWYKIGYASTMG